MNDFGSRKSSPLVWIAVTLGIAVAGAAGSELLWLHSRVTTIRADRFTAEQGAKHSEKIKVLEVKIDVINGIVQDIQAIRKDIHLVNMKLVEIGTHMKITHKDE